MGSPDGVVARSVRTLGSRVAVADLLGVDRAQVDAWLAGTGTLTSSQRRILTDLRTVTDRLAQLRAVPAGWLRSPCAALDGATPDDVLVVDGAARVLSAIDHELAGR